MKIGNQEIKTKTGEAVELHEGEYIQLLVPASMGRTSIHLSVICGKLEIAGGSSIISNISGPGMIEKVRV
ncbi:hypothetical protein JW977_04205 [Candidatus Falkowbacteria bacterium]|nr:hypothetical protein [Candidatus Falkowbacteria bacterium]